MTSDTRYGSATDVGLLRSGNEDALLVLPEADVFVVADGLGGHAAGEVASALAVGELEEALAGVGDVDAAQVGATLSEALLRSHVRVVEAGRAPERRGMGTTAVVAHLRPGRAWIAHVGDSRGYLLSGGRMRQVTKDHERFGSLTQALGLGDVQPDVTELEAGEGDRLLLCTDGLTNTTDDDDIAQLLAEGTPQEATDALVLAALQNGGIDNVTVVVADGL
jgi:PPM family protein phosphatase